MSHKNIPFLSVFFCVALILAGCAQQTASREPRVKSPADTKEVKSALDLIKSAPDSPVGYVQLASAYIRAGRESGNVDYSIRAEDAIRRALELDATNIPAKKLEATLALSFHRFAEGLEMATNLQAELPNDPFVYGLLTDANNELGKYEDGVAAAQKMVDLRPNASSYARVGHVRALHGDMNGAIEAFKLAARMTDPADREGQSWCMVQVGDQYWANGRYVEAERSFDEALTNFPDYYLALAGKGRTLAARGRYPEAAEFLGKAQAGHLNLETIILLGDVYAKLGDEARSEAQYALAEGGEQTLGAANDPHRVALFWADRSENLEKAVAIAEADYSAQQDIHASDTLAWCYYRNGRLVEAKRLAKEAMRLGTADAKILYHAGMIETGLGNRNEARRLLEAALRLNPGFDVFQAPVAEATVKRLANMPS
jgi:tetratricopeptide (TPR) repeat protein